MRLYPREPYLSREPYNSSENPNYDGSEGKPLALAIKSAEIHIRHQNLLASSTEKITMTTVAQNKFALDVSHNDIQILLADDDGATRQLLQFCLEREGYQVVAVRNGQEALQAFAVSSFDMVILDVMMPVVDGWTVCAELRKRTDVPIMLLTGNTNTDDIVHGIRLGADSYVTKPFTLKELRARVQAVLRRASQKTERQESNILQHGKISLNEGAHEVTVGNQKVDLPPTEYRLLQYFMHNPDKAISNEELLVEVWGYQPHPYEDLNFVRVTMSRLRSKVEENASTPKYLQTVHGRGYQLCTNNQAAYRPAVSAPVFPRIEMAI